MHLFCFWFYYEKVEKEAKIVNLYFKPENLNFNLFISPDKD